MFPPFYWFTGAFYLDSLKDSVDKNYYSRHPMMEEKIIRLSDKENETFDELEAPSLPHLITDSKFLYLKRPSDYRPRTYIMKDIIDMDICAMQSEVKETDYNKKNLIVKSFKKKRLGSG